MQKGVDISPRHPDIHYPAVAVFEDRRAVGMSEWHRDKCRLIFRLRGRERRPSRGHPKEGSRAPVDRGCRRGASFARAEE